MNADWNNQYLTKTGEVQNRNSFCEFIRKILNHLPVINAMLPKTDIKDIYEGAGKIQQLIIEALTTGITPDNETLTKSAAKINELFDKLAAKRPEDAEALKAAYINVKALITLQPRPELSTTPASQEPAAENVATPAAEAVAVILDNDKVEEVTITPPDSQANPEVVEADPKRVDNEPQQAQAPATQAQNDPELDDLLDIHDMDEFPPLPQRAETDTQARVVDVVVDDEVAATPKQVTDVAPTTPSKSQKLSSRQRADQSKKAHASRFVPLVLEQEQAAATPTKHKHSKKQKKV